MKNDNLTIPNLPYDACMRNRPYDITTQIMKLSKQGGFVIY